MNELLMVRGGEEKSAGLGVLELREQDGAERLRIAYLRAKADDLFKEGPQEPPMACAVAEGKPVQQKVLLRGNPATPGETCVPCSARRSAA